NLEAAYTILKAKGGKGPGLDGLTFDDLTTAELHEMFRGVSQAIKTRTYKPHPVRHVEIPKANGKKRLLSIPTIADRTAAKAFLICLDSFFKKLLPGVGRSTHRLFAQMDKVMRERKHFVLAIDDIRDCFPSAPIDKVVEIFRGHISQPDLIWLFESIVRGQEGPERVTGLDQGSPVSPVGMELLLHSCPDAEMEFRHQGKTQLLWYVDNLTFVTGSVREGEEALRLANETLDETGFTLKGEDGEPQDIRDLVLQSHLSEKSGYCKTRS
ncbi:MAG: reverse transcriptase domain-containing protein, partial [Planctomycetaceae bacterium]